MPAFLNASTAGLTAEMAPVLLARPENSERSYEIHFQLGRSLPTLKVVEQNREIAIEGQNDGFGFDRTEALTQGKQEGLGGNRDDFNPRGSKNLKNLISMACQSDPRPYLPLNCEGNENAYEQKRQKLDLPDRREPDQRGSVRHDVYFLLHPIKVLLI